MGSVFVAIVHTTSAQGYPIFSGNNGTSVASIQITNSGSAYGGAPTVQITPAPAGGVTATGTAVLTSGAVTSVTITNPGSGYLCPPRIFFTTGAATGIAIMSNPNPYDTEGVTVNSSSWVDWSSGISHIAVNVQQPAGMSALLYQSKINAGLSYLDGALSAWCTFSTFQSTGFNLDVANFGVAALDS